MSIDYLDQSDDENLGEAKDVFFDYILQLERLLDEAEKLGAMGDSKLFLVLDEAVAVHKEAEYHARDRAKSFSLENARKRIEKIERQYLPLVFENMLKILGEEVSSGIEEPILLEQKEEIQRLLNYYNDRHADLGLSSYEKKMSTIGVRIEEAT